MTAWPAAGLASRASEEEAADRLVRAHYYEGLPEEEIWALGPAGLERLALLLDDPSERPFQANIIEVLGRRGGSVAREALLRYARKAPRGEVDPDTYRARMALRLALGRLARHDDAALALLLQMQVGEGPRWSSGHLRGEHLERLMRRVSARALALSGRPEAEAWLRGLLAQAEQARDSRAREALRDALALHARSARERREGANP